MKMIQLIKRFIASAGRPINAEMIGNSSSTGAGSWPPITEPMPIPEVIEGNAQEDWDLWQSSLNNQISLFASPCADMEPGKLDDGDSRSSVAADRRT